MIRNNLARFFIILLGFIFFVVAALVSMTEVPDVIPIGIGIVGIFLIILPFTYQKTQQT